MKAMKAKPIGLIRMENRSKIGYTDTTTELVIPEYFTDTDGNEYKVRVIGYMAFHNCDSLTSVVIPNSVKYIARDAFSCCGSLTNITIPDSVIHVGYNAFAYTPWLRNKQKENPLVIVGDGMLIDVLPDPYMDDIIIPHGVKTIATNAFSRCLLMNSVTIPNTVQDICYDAFDLCGSLTTVNYTGTKKQWKKINVFDNNDSLIKATKVYNYKLS